MYEYFSNKYIYESLKVGPFKSYIIKMCYILKKLEHHRNDNIRNIVNRNIIILENGS